MHHWQNLLTVLACTLLITISVPIPSSAATFESCPDATTVQPSASYLSGILSSDRDAAIDAYQKGYAYGCPQGLMSYDYTTEFTLKAATCNNYPLTPAVQPGSWVVGCNAGVTKALRIQAHNLTTAQTTIDAIKDPTCADIGAECVEGFLGRLGNLTKETACGSPASDSCSVGYSRAESTVFSGAASTAYPVPTITPAIEAKAAGLQNCGLTEYLSTHTDSISQSPAFTLGFKTGCVTGYDKAFTGWVHEDVFNQNQETTCKGLVNERYLQTAPPNELHFGVGTVAGCKQGVDRAWKTKPPEEVSEAIIDRAINVIGCTPTKDDADWKNGFAKGCWSGYKLITESTTPIEKNKAVAQCADGRITNRYIRISNFNEGYEKGCTTGIERACRASTTICAKPTKPGVRATRDISGAGIVPACDPALPPSAPGACGVNKLIELLQNIMRYLWYVAIPLGGLMLGWGGFNIMTAAGNEEKMSAGYSAIKVTIIGYAIMLASYLIIKTIFTVLGVNAPSGLF